MPESKTPDPVAYHAQARPHALACLEPATGRRWTYSSFSDDINRARTVLSEVFQIERGQRVAVIARNSADLVILQQATMRMGAIFAPINWRLSRTEQDQILADCRPSLLVTDQEERVSGPSSAFRILAVAEFATSVAKAEPCRSMDLPGIESPIILLYTSGTSGRPKGVLITGRNCFATAVNFGVLGEVGHDSVFLCDAPMFHVIGLITCIHPPLLHGGTLVMSPGFDPATTNQRLADEALGVTHYFCIPQMAQALRDAPNFQPEKWSRLKALFTGGAPNPASNIRWWLARGVMMVDGYGMTEAGTLLGMPLDKNRIDEKAGAAGLVPPALSLRIVDEDDREVADGKAGEILVFGPNVTPGYWASPEETAKAFALDGWLRTGDLGSRDADGFITIVDRRKDMFISGGENVYPVEVEAALSQHPNIREVAVIGVPDHRWGEVGRAFVVLRQESPSAAEELATHCAALIARYKVPKEFLVVDKLPRSAAGKILKNQLRSN